MGFQSTPPHGGRPARHTYLMTLPSFNPRPRMGGDLYISPSAIYTPVSIHAPAWGATRQRGHREAPAGSFNPRPRMGGDQCGISTGRDRDGFNPRPRMGGDTRALAAPAPP